jgi:hypothetical protein
MLLVLALHLKNQITKFWKTDYRFGFLDPENLWSNFIKIRYFLKRAYSWGENQTRKFWEIYYKFLIYSSGIGHFDKVTNFYKVWWKVSGVEESESVIGFSKFCNLIFSSGIAHFEKVTNFYKVWSKVFGVKESESVIGFSKFCNLIFEMEGRYQYHQHQMVLVLLHPYGYPHRIALEDLWVPW